LSEISHDELQQWRHTEKQRRNREYANASIKRVRERIKHLEEEILSYQRKLTDVQNEIDKLQENPFGNSDTTSDKFAIGHRMGHRGTIKQPLKLQRGPIVPSRYFAINKNNIIHNDSEQSVPKSHQCTAMR
jgi:predicted RNase H-like nuclease (RuvC/YqgF family)